MFSLDGGKCRAWSLKNQKQGLTEEVDHLNVTSLWRTVKLVSRTLEVALPWSPFNRMKLINRCFFQRYLTWGLVTNPVFATFTKSLIHLLISKKPFSLNQHLSVSFQWWRLNFFWKFWECYFFWIFHTLEKWENQIDALHIKNLLSLDHIIFFQNHLPGHCPLIKIIFSGHCPLIKTIIQGIARWLTPGYRDARLLLLLSFSGTRITRKSCRVPAPITLA